MPEYAPETMDPREIGAFLSQREQGGLARAMAGSVPGTAEFAAANRGKGRLEQLASALGSAGGGSSSMALGAVIPAAALKQMTGEVIRSIPRHLRQTLRPKSRKINVLERAAEEMNEDFFPTPGTYGRSGYYERQRGIPGEGSFDPSAAGKITPKTIEEIAIHEELPEAFKRQVLTHELAEHARRGWRQLLPHSEPEMQEAMKAVQGLKKGLLKKGYRNKDMTYEPAAHVAELTQKSRLGQTSGEETAMGLFVKTRRALDRIAEKEHKAIGTAKSLGLEREYGIPIYRPRLQHLPGSPQTRRYGKLDLPAAVQTEAEVQKALRDYEAARIQSLVK